MATFVAWHGKTLNEHCTLRDDAAKKGYRFLSLSIHGTAGDPRYTAVMIKRAQVVAQRDFPFMTEAEWQATFSDQAQKRYGPMILTATGPAGAARFAAVFQPQSPVPLTRHRLKNGEDTDLETIQGMNKKAKLDGLILRWADSYSDVVNPRFTAIWTPNTDKTIWNADGTLETVEQYQARFEAQHSGWARPTLVTPNASNVYFSHFVDNQIGGFVARHNMSGAKYQEEFDTWTPKGYFPICVQAGGSGSSTRYAALFVKRETPIQREFHATGPVANAAIDDLFKNIMQKTPVRHMSVAIVHNAKLVFARGYTWAEPDYPICQPTTRFRQASVSKTIMAMAIYQLIEKGLLSLSDKVQDILKLKTPSGGSPVNSKFKDVTIRHLLEHTSGINANDYRKEISIRDAWKAAKPNQTFHLPMNAEQTDSYIASLAKVADPEDEQVYNNCGYYLLGRVLAKKRNRATAIAALQDFLFEPLDITRIRTARSRVEDQPSDEARYRINAQGTKEDNDLRLNIGIGSSVMEDDRHWVPLGYGTEHYEKQEGSGGLSAAATDLGRILAALMWQHNTAALKRTTVESMFNNAIACGQKFGNRAGHGWDGAAARANNRFYGQKGGSLDTSGNTLQINGDWAFACNIAGKMAWTPDGKGIYPDFPAMMSIAKTVNWGNTDLFPAYGMPSFLALVGPIQPGPIPKKSKSRTAKGGA
jgi:CubicO group peptidase (beta-lactamase class C family)